MPNSNVPSAENQTSIWEGVYNLCGLDYQPPTTIAGNLQEIASIRKDVIQGIHKVSDLA